MRLLLDELYSAKIAEQLRLRGYDAICVTERPDLVSCDDEALLLGMTEERRALVTDNYGDFGPMLARLGREGVHHYGVIFTSGRRLPRSRAGIGLYLRHLEAYLADHPEEDALIDTAIWLPLI